MSAHPAYADTGEPVEYGDYCFQAGVSEISGDAFLWASHVLESWDLSNTHNPYTFYKHRHNAIAAWEALLEESE